MNRIDYNQSGGFPVSTQILAAAQDAYQTFNKFSYLAGNLVIITGCEISSGSYVNEGFVAINGELLPFAGGNNTGNVIITETSDLRGFEDGSVKSVIYSRYACFGAGEVEFPFSEFRRPLTLLQLEDRLLKMEKSVPIGLVAIWDQPANAIPPGWVEHIPLAGFTAVGHLPEDPNFGALGAFIGAAQVTLEKSNLPKINFGWTGKDGTGWPNQSADTTNAGTPNSYVRNTQNLTIGGDQAHSNIQPSHIVKYIRFVGFN